MINWLHVSGYLAVALDMERRGQHEEAVISIVDLMYISPSLEALLWEDVNKTR